MTDQDPTRHHEPPIFLNRRQRREYERALENEQSAANQNLIRSEPAAKPADIAPTIPMEDPRAPELHVEEPEPLATDGPGGLKRTPQRPVSLGRNETGTLKELPTDQRDYPKSFEASFEDNDASYEDAESLGYLMVAEDNANTLGTNNADQELRKRRKRKRTVIMLTTIALFLGLLAVVGIGVGKLVGWTNNDYPGPGGEEIEFIVHPGEGAIVIGNRLVEQDIVASTGAFRDAVESVDTASQIQPGDYTLRNQMSAREAAEELLQVNVPGMGYIHIDSGDRIGDVFEKLAASTEFSEAEIEAAAQPTNFDLPEEALTLEGYVAVGEYQFPIDSSVHEVLEHMIEPTLEEFERLDVDDPARQHEFVTIASIVEAEARPNDYSIVAGIIENRLDSSNTETHGLLQIDATVIYGMGVQQLQFSSADRRDASNPYNTYVHRGLPPGPIGAPSIAALDAAAEPAPSDYYYWITTNIETGETKFSSTYEQHQQYHQEYRSYCDENPSICGRD